MDEYKNEMNMEHFMNSRFHFGYFPELRKHSVDLLGKAFPETQNISQTFKVAY